MSPVRVARVVGVHVDRGGCRGWVEQAASRLAWCRHPAFPLPPSSLPFFLPYRAASSAIQGYQPRTLFSVPHCHPVAAEHPSISTQGVLLLNTAAAQTMGWDFASEPRKPHISSPSLCAALWRLSHFFSLSTPHYILRNTPALPLSGVSSLQFLLIVIVIDPAYCLSLIPVPLTLIWPAPFRVLFISAHISICLYKSIKTQLVVCA
ncbi:hypothetical protein GQ54DRAFT_58913 [Martensiomyces pterosporus]|nr:hypothetical protein GQ54DRAFT_58913 [Martensiomyces pterosporus]